MKIQFEPMTMEHQTPIMEIFNYHIKTGTAAFPSNPLPEPFFGMLLKKQRAIPPISVKMRKVVPSLAFANSAPIVPSLPSDPPPV